MIAECDRGTDLNRLRYGVSSCRRLDPTLSVHPPSQN